MFRGCWSVITAPSFVAAVSAVFVAVAEEVAAEADAVAAR